MSNRFCCVVDKRVYMSRFAVWIIIDKGAAKYVC